MTSTDRKQLPSHLTPGNEIHIVVSVLSGKHNAQEYFNSQLKPFLDNLSLSQGYSVHPTTSAQTIVELTRTVFAVRALEGIKQTIILLSGDGGIVDIVDTLNSELKSSRSSTRTRSQGHLVFHDPASTPTLPSESKHESQSESKLRSHLTPAPAQKQRSSSSAVVEDPTARPPTSASGSTSEPSSSPRSSFTSHSVFSEQQSQFGRDRDRDRDLVIEHDHDHDHERQPDEGEREAHTEQKDGHERKGQHFSSSLSSDSGYVRPVICLVPEGTANALAWSGRIAGPAPESSETNTTPTESENKGDAIDNPLNVILHGRPKPLPQFEVTFSPGAKWVVNEGKDRVPITSTAPSEPRTQHGIDRRAAEEKNTHDQRATTHGAVVFSWGLHASLVAMSDSSSYRKHGIQRFRMAAEELMKENHAYAGTVKYKPTETKPFATSTVTATATAVDADEFEHGNDEEWHVLTHRRHRQRDGPNLDRDRDRNRTLTSDDSEVEIKHSYVMATLVSNLEEKFRISPSSAVDPLNGDLYLLAIPAVQADRIMQIMGQAYQNGAHVKPLHPEQPQQAGGEKRREEEEREGHDLVTYLPISALRISFSSSSSSTSTSSSSSTSTSSSSSSPKPGTASEGEDGGKGENEKDQEDKEDKEEKWRQICIDGKIVAVEENGWVEVRKTADLQRDAVVELVVP